MLDFCSFPSKQSQFAFFVTFAFFVAGGCGPSDRKPIHEMAEHSDGVAISCQRCYDLAVRVSRGPPKLRRYKTVERHACPDCASDAVIYEGPSGKAIIRCEGCAPEGVPCDRCLPPTMSVGHDKGPA